MKAMLLNAITNLSENEQPLTLSEIDRPEPGAAEVLLRVRVCGVCHTELDEIEGRTAPPKLPVVPGHEIIGEVVALGEGCSRLEKGQRVGVAWIHHACGQCEYCQSGQENLCPEFVATGRDANGGYAEYMVVHEAFAHPIPEAFQDEEAAPLLCAGAIGYRSLRLADPADGQLIGLTGFGGSGHLMLKMLKFQYPEAKVFVFARNPEEQQFALDLGAAWAGDTAASAPEPLHAIIDTTPVWKPVVEALKELRPGGRLVINAIRKEPADQDYLQHLRYEDHLWMEREIKSVANVARRDVREFLQLAAEAGIRPDYEPFALKDANEALLELKRQKIRGAKVLRVWEGE